MSVANIYVDSKRVTGIRDKKIYGHFLEHFHRQIYSGIYDPASPLSNAAHFRTDVIEALKKIDAPVVRWPGGCFVSGYHWLDGVGKQRKPSFDKAWRVEEPNLFGTDEFIEYCREIGAEPYICTNAGTGSPEEMSDWVEYCNLENEGRWAKLRIENGHPQPYRVKYWSIGNENYGAWEIGAKNAQEWGRFVKESAKMMKRVDPSIELLAASVSDLDWNLNLLKEAGELLHWISIHGYWDPIWQDNKLAPYEKCMAYTTTIEEPILKTKYILGSLGFLGKIRIAYDEWNLRGWYHPNIHQNVALHAADYVGPRDDNDINSSYTLADAIFTACFLNQALKHCDIVGMTNYAPSVNTRGLIFTHQDGVVLRSTYFVFELYTRFMNELVIDSYIMNDHCFQVTMDETDFVVPSLDVLATRNLENTSLSIAIVNRHPEKPSQLKLSPDSAANYRNARIYQISAKSKDSYNDVDRPHEIKIEEIKLPYNPNNLCIEVPEHSISVLVLS